MTDEGSDLFRDHRMLIHSELQRLSNTVEMLNTKVDALRGAEIADLKVQIAMLQVKSGVWGALAGIVSAVGVYLATVHH